MCETVKKNYKKTFRIANMLKHKNTMKMNVTLVLNEASTPSWLWDY